ncbi:MAG: chemotaxis protein CheX [Planctomycetaceae bacterium]|nr:chemotaxis protein CheX [Planctomycetaceae bacterium]
MPVTDVDFINPVITSLEETFDTMLNCKISRVGLMLKDNNTALHPISGIIGVNGKQAVGTVVLTMTETVALRAASTLLMMEVSEPDEDVMDAVGELTNMVAGATKAKLAQYHLSMGLPSVFHGNNCRIHFPANAHPIVIPFQSAWGALALEVGFTFMN